MVFNTVSSYANYRSTPITNLQDSHKLPCVVYNLSFYNNHRKIIQAERQHHNEIKHALITNQYSSIVTFFTVTSVRLSVPLSSAKSVCPAVKAYKSVTMDWILIKLGESVGT